MNAIVAPPPSGAIHVTLADGEDGANIFAKLLKQHIEGIAHGDPAKSIAASKIRGKLGLHSTDPEALVTLVFDDNGIIIRNGFDADLDGRITGPLKLQTETLIGAANPYTAMLRRRLKVGVRWSRPLFTAQTYAFLKVPESMRTPTRQAP
ncbi:MAG TPA: hypothetical protein VEZ14_03160 [Dehalococcoidia bacterium]|nr:hypothetical protein [Dehalococcoidia bacterium]